MRPGACYDSIMTTTPASEKQIRFIDSLLSERRVPEGWEKPSVLTGGRNGSASSLITWLLAQPRKPREDKPQPELGVYVMSDGTLVLAQPNKAGTNVYTKRFVDSGLRVRDERGDWARGDWEYAPEFKRQLGSARKMTAAEAKAFIVRYGKCPRCSHKLKAAQSVERGIGPVCRNYWPDWEEQFAA